MNTTNENESRATRGVPNSAQVLAAALLACALACVFMMQYVPDDSYISFRFAENLAAGHGLTFNAGEAPVEAYSNFLWIVVCAFFYRLGLNLPSATPFAGTLLAMATVALLWLMYRRRRMPPLQMLFPLLFVGASGPFVMYAVSGMETALFAFLLLAMMFILDRIHTTGSRGAWVGLAVVGVLLSLCRPEGIVAFPALAAFTFWAERRFPGNRHRARLNATIAAIVFVAAIVAYHAWRVDYFGHWLPTPLISKGGGGKSLFFAWGKNLQIYFIRQGFYFPPVGHYFAALAAAAIVGRNLSRSRRGLALTETAALFLGLLFFAVYFNFVDWMPGMRYQCSLVGLLLLPAAQMQAPFFAAKNRVSRTAPGTRASSGGALHQTARNGLAFWLVGAAATLMSFSALSELRIVAHEIETSNRSCTVALGRWLRDTLPADATIAISDVGAVPYYSRMRTIDIHPESLTDIHIATEGFSKEYVLKNDPAVLMIPSRSLFMAKVYPEHFTMLEDPRFKKKYRLLGVSRYEFYNDRCYHVLIDEKYPKLSKERMDAFPHGVGNIARKFQ